ncbi:MAG: hypothetical protein AB7J32_18650 [Pseudonocardia sp.]
MNVQLVSEFLVGLLGDVGPDDAVGAASGSEVLGSEAGLGDPRAYRLEVDAAVRGQLQLPEPVDDVVGRLAGDAGENEVAVRADRRTAQHRELADGRVRGEDVENGRREVGRRGDPQAQHHGSVPW